MLSRSSYRPYILQLMTTAAAGYGTVSRLLHWIVALLVLAMTIRCIPLLAGVVAEVTEARRARGLGFSLRALAVPVVIGALRTADAMGEALAARGVDD